jgi:urocanate hydratase
VLQGFFVFGKGARLVLNGIDLQRQTLLLYGELLARRESWAGLLVFACGEGVSATGLPAAVSIAGGTSLMLDPHAAAVKAVFRAGGVDFVVNTLDEALRVLKNEIRKRRPLSVALDGAEQQLLHEMSERGVAPDLQVMLEAGVAFPGARRLELATESGLALASEALRLWLRERGWFEVVMERATMAEIRDLDKQLLELLPESLRRTWVQRIGHYQRASAGGARVMWLSEAERRVADSWSDV